MSWRRFTTLLAGLSGEAVYRCLTGNAAAQRRPLTAADAPAFFASFPKRRAD